MLAQGTQGVGGGLLFTVGEDDIVVDQAPLRVETDELAARAQSRVEGEDRFFTQRRSQQELAQVFGEDADRFGVGALARLHAHLRLHGQRQQAFEAVHHGEAHLDGSGVVGFEEAPFQHGKTLALGTEDAEAEDFLALAATHG